MAVWKGWVVDRLVQSWVIKDQESGVPFPNVDLDLAVPPVIMYVYVDGLALPLLVHRRIVQMFRQVTNDSIVLPFAPRSFLYARF